jgi:hypothetical protein
VKRFRGNTWGNSRQDSSPFDVTAVRATSDVGLLASTNDDEDCIG